MGKLAAILFFLPALAAPLSAAAPTAVGTAGDGFLVFRAERPRVLEFHHYDTAQIERLLARRDLPVGQHVPGITEAEYHLDVSVRVGWKKAPADRYFRMWVESVEVDFSYDRIVVHVSVNYRKGSCPYEAVLEHERRHVAVHEKTHEEFATRLREALLSAKTIPREGEALPFHSVEGGQKVLNERVRHVVDPIRALFARTLRARQAQLDSPESYRAVHERCDDWNP